MLTEEFKRKLEQQVLSYQIGNVSLIRSATPVHGGSINDCYLLDTDDGAFFLKINSAGKYPNIFEREASGLDSICKTDSLMVPEVYLVEYLEGKTYLLTEYIEKGPPLVSSWDDLGRGLAQMHKATHTQFGFYDDNYIGSLPQINDWYNDWCDLFIERRLRVQVKRATDVGLLDREQVHAFDRLYKQLPNILTKEPPALLHGDFWSGNFMFTVKGRPVIFDPAAYYGNREVDIAMSRLFGGFDRAFYDAYFETFPVEASLEERTDIYNLYPLLVHLNLFGRSYLSDIRSIIKRY